VVRVPSDTEGENQQESHGVTLSLRRELTRKALHLLSVVVPVGYAAGLARALVVWVLVGAMAIALVVEIARARSVSARTVFHAGVGLLLREHEFRRLSGATWLILALLTAALCFPPDVAIAAMCAVALGDAAAAIVGRTLAPARSEGRKSFAGSVACFAASAIAARAIASFAWHEALIAGVLASLSERPRGPLDDNLRITLAVGCGILLWRMGFS
jgi:dolichol kinase